MRFKSIWLATAIFLFPFQMIMGQQIFPAENLNSANPSPDCTFELNKIRTDMRAGNPGQPSAVSQNNSEKPGEEETPSLPILHLELDLSLLKEKLSALAQCIFSAEAQGAPEKAQGDCSEMLLLNFEMRHEGEAERDIPIGHLPGSSAFFYESGMTIDADGAPNAYHPDNSGIDDLENAGVPGTWEGLAKDAHGEPFIQGPNDPYPGFYVSETALADRSKAVNDPARYVDASKIPFLVLPGGLARQLGARVGDFAIVFNERNKNSSYAIFGDVGPYDRLGEGSMALAENLGIRSDARNGGARRGVLYLVFPGSGEGRPRTIEEINEVGQKLLGQWETEISAKACEGLKSISPSQGNHPAN